MGQLSKGAVRDNFNELLQEPAPDSDATSVPEFSEIIPDSPSLKL